MSSLVCPVDPGCRAYEPTATFCPVHLIDLVEAEDPVTRVDPPPPPVQAACWRCRTTMTSDADLCPGCQARQPGPALALVFPGGRAIEVEPGRTVRLGRDTHPPLTAPNISRDHAELGLDPAGGWIRDRGSLNGTWVNGEDLGDGGEARLEDGDDVGLGNNPRARVVVRRTR